MATSSVYLWVCISCVLLARVLATEPTETPAVAAPNIDPKTWDRSHRGHMQVLDADARIYLWKGFLSDEECDYIRAKAEERLKRSGVVVSETGEEMYDSVRTSDGMFFDRSEDPVIEAIEKRIADWTLLPVHYGEGLQVLRYRPSQKYDAHWDYFFHKEGSDNGGNRYATVLTYLTDVEEGGETVFPNIPAPGGVNEGFSECAKYSLAAKPRKGDAVLFHSMKPNGELEKRSLHTACPVIKGVKWSMPKWIHTAHYTMADKVDAEYTRQQEIQKELMNTAKEF